MREHASMEEYLASTELIDWKTPDVFKLASALSSGQNSEEKSARACFEWVRDHIKHSWDYKLNPTTCKASDVLKHKTGYCYAKSHLLAALLRANNLPAGLCYQRLSVEGNGVPYSLHGLNAVYLNQHGWYRIDARGNKEGVHAQFTPPIERLAFPINDPLEANFPKIWASPSLHVVSVLEKYPTYQEVYDHLPDVA